jgi:hypothetical protein
MEVKDDPALVFSGTTKDWPAFKDAIQCVADRLDTTCLFEGGRSLAQSFASQLKEKTGTKVMRAASVAREVAKNDSNHVPTSVDANTDADLKGWFEDKDIATGLLLSLNKNRLTSLGSNFTDHKKLGFKDEEAIAAPQPLLKLGFKDEEAIAAPQPLLQSRRPTPSLRQSCDRHCSDLLLLLNWRRSKSGGGPGSL